MVESAGPARGPLGAIAQLEERLDRTQEVAGSSPASSIRLRSRTESGLGEMTLFGSLAPFAHRGYETGT